MKRRRQLPRIFILIDSMLLALVTITAVISYDIVHDIYQLEKVDLTFSATSHRSPDSNNPASINHNR